MAVDVIDLTRSIDSVKKMVVAAKGAYICVSNVHMCMEAYDSTAFRAVVNGADLVIPDGRPLYWAQKLLGAQSPEQVRGQDLMNALCDVSAMNGLNIGLYGGSSAAVLDCVVRKLESRFPGINITYAHSPPFRALTAEEDSVVINDIELNKVQVLFVGIGCPKQEYWMAEHKDMLSCAMIGVGAAYDFIAGTKKYAPKWLQVMGLEWLFRLVSEPKRLWKRYLKQGPRFIYHFFLQLVLRKNY
jgi:N-acetylglucosaminyldiphosphoundecaprenol N-acetyl-beta-D-mannosaminyltransferase